MHLGDHGQRLRRVERLSLGELDQHVDRIGAGQLHVEPLAGFDRLLACRAPDRQGGSAAELRIAERQADRPREADETVEAGRRHHAHRDPAAEPAQHVERLVHAFDAGDEARLVAHQQDAEQRHAASAPPRGRSASAIRPASPKVRIRSECENCKAMKETPAVAWVSTQAGPTISSALRKAVNLSSPASRRSRAAKVSCMLSEKLITMMSGVITFRNMLRRKSSQPSAPSARRMASSGGAGGDDHERDAAEEQRRRSGSRRRKPSEL